jgi:hypothetical protein
MRLRAVTHSGVLKQIFSPWGFTYPVSLKGTFFSGTREREMRKS